MRSPDVVLSRYDLLEAAWDSGYENRSNVISVHIRALREKIDRPFGLHSIETVRGSGSAAKRRGLGIRRLPIRLKLTLAFTIVMAVVLTATGFFLYLRLRSELDNRLNQNLHAHRQVVTALLERGAAGGGEAALRSAGSSRDGAGFVQLTAPSGRIVAGTEGLHRTALLSSAEIARSRAATHSSDLDADRADLGAVRVLAGPVHAGHGNFVVTVGTSLEDRNQALSNLRTLLLLGEPVALLLAGPAAYAVISAALRPVEAMRRRAAAISVADLGQRLPLSPSRDELRRVGETLNAMLMRSKPACSASGPSSPTPATSSARR